MLQGRSSHQDSPRSVRAISQPGQTATSEGLLGRPVVRGADAWLHGMNAIHFYINPADTIA